METRETDASSASASRFGGVRRAAAFALRTATIIGVGFAGGGLAIEVGAVAKAHALQTQLVAEELAYADPSGLFQDYVGYLEARALLDRVSKETSARALVPSSYDAVLGYLDSASGLLVSLRDDGHPLPGVERIVSSAQDRYADPFKLPADVPRSFADVDAALENAVAGRWPSEALRSVEGILAARAVQGDKRIRGVEFAVAGALFGFLSDVGSAALRKPYKTTS